MSVHEFVTISMFYLENMLICSVPLAVALCRKMASSVEEFNEYQLFLLKSTLEQAFVSERKKFADDDEQASQKMFSGSKDLIIALE